MDHRPNTDPRAPAEPAADARPDQAAFAVSVILERRPAQSRWAEHLWSAVGITIGTPDPQTAPQLVREDAASALYRVDGLDVRLFADECESYYFNLVSASPRAFVIAHCDTPGAQPEPFHVSMSFDEAHAYLEGDDEIFAVPVPPELYRWTEAFVIDNYFPQKKTKRKLRDWSAEAADPGQP